MTKHGVKSRIYMGTGTAIPIAETHGLNVTVETDFAEDSSQGDSWKTYLAGLSDFKVEISKWYDEATNVLLFGVINRSTFKFYFYPDASDNTTYMYGTAQLGGGGFDAQINGVVDQSYTLVAVSQPTLIGAA